MGNVESDVRGYSYKKSQNFSLFYSFINQTNEKNVQTNNSLFTQKVLYVNSM